MDRLGGMTVVGEREIEFNLLDEPWIIVRTKSNETKTLSLLEVFQQSHEIQALAGELPTQDIAIMRLLLAVMHAAFIDERVEDSEDAVDCWMELWGMKKFPFDIIREYLEQYRDRFWLFHPTQPFYQSAHIVENMAKYKRDKGIKSVGKDKAKTVAKLVGDLSQSDHKLRLFPSRTGINQKEITYSEAARWLIHINAFDDKSAKYPTPVQRGYLGELGLVYVKGKNLFETLMLNFALVDHREELFDDCKKGSKAYWEKPICENINNEMPPPRAQKELLTLQSRRILLRRDNGKVTGYWLTMGDYFDLEVIYGIENMTTWNYEETDIKPKRYMEQDVERQIWRDFSALLGMSKNPRPGVVQWLQNIKKELPEFKLFKLTAVGATYDRKNMNIADYIYDDLSINASLLDAMKKEWIDEIIKLLKITNQAVNCLGTLAVKIAEASGQLELSKNNKKFKNGDKERREIISRNACENGYHCLDILFRKWLLTVDPNNGFLDDKINKWLDEVKIELLSLGRGMLSRCSDVAIVGRRKEDVEMDAVKAFVTFTRKLKNILG